jgi:hypothetical protein
VLDRSPRTTPSSVGVNPETSDVIVSRVEIKEAVPKKDRYQLYAERMLNSSGLKEDKAVLAAVSQLRSKVLETRQTVFVKPEDNKVPKFYINMKSKQATLISNDKGALIEESPYNQMIAVLSGPHPQLATAMFVADEQKLFINEPARQVGEMIAAYIEKVRKAQLEIEESTAEKKDLLKAINRFVVNRAWKEFTNIDNLIYPPKTKEKINGHVRSLKGKKREKDSRKLDITYRRLLLREIEKLFTQEGETYAHALVHGLEIAADESVRTLKELWERFLRQHPSMCPSWDDIEINGILPSVKMKEYKNLFSPLEWQIIGESKILDLESRIQKLHQSKLNFDGIMNLLIECQEIRKMIKENDFLDHYIAIKRERLLVCGELKRSSKKAGSLNMWREVGINFNSSQKVRTAFGIGRMHIESKRLPGSSWEALNNQLFYDKKVEAWVLRDVKSPDLSNPLALTLASEFMNLINR